MQRFCMLYGRRMGGGRISDVGISFSVVFIPYTDCMSG